MGISTTSLILGLVKYIHVRNDVLCAESERGLGTIDPLKYKSRRHLIRFAGERLQDHKATVGARS